mmetsp:Transcript_40984/g.63981  ORF Transcript_40984/g.63981 Transcript_40984/m.63981 type:complete len:232 (+) Transcript_40984:1064-1759(+)
MNLSLMIVETCKNKRSSELVGQISEFFERKSLLKIPWVFKKIFLRHQALILKFGISHLWFFKFSIFSDYISITSIIEKISIRFHLKKFLLSNELKTRPKWPKIKDADNLMFFNNFEKNILELKRVWKVFSSLIPRIKKPFSNRTKIFLLSYDNFSKQVELRFYYAFQISLGSKNRSKKLDYQLENSTGLHSGFLCNKERTEPNIYKTNRWNIWKSLKVVEIGPRLTLKPFL